MNNSQKLKQFVNEAELTTYDFDGTLTDDSVPSPKGITVPLAYQHAVDTVFDAPGLFEDMGGLQNRAPLEIADAALKRKPMSIQEAFDYYERNKGRFSKLVPRGKGVNLSFAYVRSDVRAYASELITRDKLGLLLSECWDTSGVPWPPQAPGVVEHVRAHREKYPERVRAVASSGHEVFITTCHERWKMPIASEYLQTDDDMRGLNLPYELMVKPSKLIIEFLVARLAHAGRVVSARKGVHFGDDEGKDGELALNAGMRFGLYNPRGRQVVLGENAFEFRHWDELTEALK